MQKRLNPLRLARLSLSFIPMKIAAILLSFYFVLISSQPVIAAVVKMTNACEMVSRCDETISSECPKNRKACPEEKNSCALCCINVFQSAFCCGALIEENNYKFSLHPESERQYPGADLILPSSYSPDCWQPPEMT